MATFQTSTQRQFWLFTNEKLQAIRAQYLGGLKPADDALLKRHFETTLLEIGSKLRFAEKVQASAVIFFKRFFLFHKLVDYDPPTMMNACLFLASKVEERQFDVVELATLLGGGPFCGHRGERIVEAELVLIDGLRSQLVVYHPYRSALGFVHQLKATSTTTAAAGETAGAVSSWNEATVLAKVHESIRALLTTDCPLLYPPGQIALGALWSVRQQFGIDLEGYIRSRFGQEAQKIVAMAQHIAKRSQESAATASQFLLTRRADGGTTGPKPLLELLARYGRARNPAANPTDPASAYIITLGAGCPFAARAAKAAEAEAKHRAKEAERSRQMAAEEAELTGVPLTAPRPHSPIEELEPVAPGGDEIELEDGEGPPQVAPQQSTTGGKDSQRADTFAQPSHTPPKDAPPSSLTDARTSEVVAEPAAGVEDDGLIEFGEVKFEGFETRDDGFLAPTGRK